MARQIFLTNRQALTLVETIVAVGIIALLLSLTLMGVQHVRESGRRLACHNNQHQLGIALNNFVSHQRKFPSLLRNRSTKGEPAFVQTAFVAILPELEVAESKKPAPGSSDEFAAPQVLRCPSSNEFLGYRFSMGSSLKTREINGFLNNLEGRSPAEITDGLSNTSALSERVSGKDLRNKPYAIIKTGITNTDNEFADNCRSAVNPQAFLPEHGLDWRGHQPKDIGYIQFDVPNSPSWDCQGLGRYQLYSARSRHHGGVNCLNCDGSVHWVSDSVDSDVWRALGTIAGSDAVHLD